MTHRYAACLAAAAFSCAAIIACSSGSDESSGATGEALGGCPPGEVRDPNGDIGPNGKIIHGCIPDPNGDPNAPTDDCGVVQHNVPVPPGLSSADCQVGSRVNGQPVWRCKDTTDVPDSLGLVTSAEGPCYRPDGTHVKFDSLIDAALQTCEGTWTGRSLRTNCLGGTLANQWTATAGTGNKFVADLVEDVVPGDWSHLPDSGQGPCTGGCASTRPPFSQ